MAVRVLTRIGAVGRRELLGCVVHDPFVPVLPAQADVAVRGENAELLVLDAHHRDVEGAPAQVVDQHRAGLRRAAGGGGHVRGVPPAGYVAVEPVGQCGGRRLVEDVEHLQPARGGGVGRGTPPALIEVGGNRDNGPRDRAELGLGVLPELLEDQGGDVDGAHPFAEDGLAAELLAHLALDAGDDAVGMDQAGAEGAPAHDHAAVGLEEHHRRRGQLSLAVADRDGIAVAVQVRHGREGRPQVDADHATTFRHAYCVLPTGCSAGRQGPDPHPPALRKPIRVLPAVYAAAATVTIPHRRERLSHAPDGPSRPPPPGRPARPHGRPPTPGQRRLTPHHPSARRSPKSTGGARWAAPSAVR